MVQALQLSRPTRLIAGVLLLTIVTIEFGGYYLTTIVRGQVELTESSRPSPGRGTRTPASWSSSAWSR